MKAKLILISCYNKCSKKEWQICWKKTHTYKKNRICNCGIFLFMENELLYN